MAGELRSIFSGRVVEEIAARVAARAPGFARERFVAEILADLPALEIMDRARRIAEGLHRHLPPDYPAALAILLASLGEDDGSGGIEGMGGFRFLPFLNYVGAYGLEHPDLSLPALRTMTKYFSAEFAIRPYLLRHPERTLANLAVWAHDPDWRVRRLVSEGTRPRLPWGMRLRPFIADPAPVLALLESLRTDPIAAVQRSVANNLNDIAKDNPAPVLATAERWLAAGDAGTKWIVRHGLRTLVKQGDRQALALLGYMGGETVRLDGLELDRETVTLGEALAFSFELVSAAGTAVRLAVDYRIHHRRANGGQTPKTFKLAVRELAPGERVRLTRRHPIVPITTRRYYPGPHRLEIMVNGLSLGTAGFTLAVPG